MPRRGENIYKRKDGRWEGRILKPDGKYQYVYAKSYREVKEQKKKFQEQIKPQTENRLADTFDASGMFENWLTGNVVHRVKPSTYESYYHCMKSYVIPYFHGAGKNCITELSAAHFVKSILEKPELSEAYREKIVAVFKVALREILEGSEDSEKILKAVKIPKAGYTPVEVFSIREQRLIEEEIQKTNDAKAFGILLCFYTGIRLGELCALKWENINFETRTMFILKSASRVKIFQNTRGKTMLVAGTPKSINSIREIPIPNFLFELSDKPIEDGKKYIFSDTNRPADPRTFQRIFKKILRNAGIKDRKFHAIRHTFATRALEMGVDIKTLSEILGHSSVQITLKVYAHSLMEHKIAAIGKLSSMYVTNINIEPFAVANSVRKM